MENTSAVASIRNNFSSWLLTLVLFLAYWIYAHLANNSIFPAVPDIARAFQNTWIGSGFATNVLPSLSNLAFGYLLGMGGGVLLGSLIGRVSIIRNITSPVISFLLTIPPIAMIPIFLLIFGVGQQMQTAIITFATLTYMLLATAAAVERIEPTLMATAKIYKIDGLRRFFQIILPYALPRILAAARVSLATAILVMVVSEMVGASRGIGAQILIAQQSFAYADMWSGLVLVGILGVGLNFIFAAVEKKVEKFLGRTK